MGTESELLKSMSNEELENSIKQKIESFHGFLTREVAIKLIAQEKGIIKEKETKYKLSEIPKDAKKVNLTAFVKKVWPVASYASSKRSRVIELKDETGHMPLVVWNDDVELTKGLYTRDEIDISGAYEKGGELHLGYSGSIEIIKRAEFPAFDMLMDNSIVHIRGTITIVEGIDDFVSGTKTRRAFSFFLTDGKMERRCIIWSDSDRYSKLETGDELVIEDALVNNGDIEVNTTARILIRKTKNMLIGEITKLECNGEILDLIIDEKEIKLDRKNALRFLNVDVAEDISLSTITRLKKEKAVAAPNISVWILTTSKIYLNTKTSKIVAVSVKNSRTAEFFIPNVFFMTINSLSKKTTNLFTKLFFSKVFLRTAIDLKNK